MVETIPNFSLPCLAADFGGALTLRSVRFVRFVRFLLFQNESYTMHPLFAQADRVSGEVIGADALVHRIMGPGLLASNC